MRFLLGFVAACITWLLVLLIPALILTLIFGQNSGITQGVAAFCVILVGPFFAFKAWGSVWRGQSYSQRDDTPWGMEDKKRRYNKEGGVIGYEDPD
jgi:hypothetical protein